MGHRFSSLHVLVLHNVDYRTRPEDPDFASRADVETCARGIADALRSRGHRPELGEVDGDTLGALIERLSRNPPDLVFNLCESLFGDARHEVVVPSLLELSGVPYTGSGPFALGLALRKDRAKEILRQRGVPTPRAAVSAGHSVAVAGATSAGAEVLARIEKGDLQFPLIVKPTREDASVGISSSSVVRDLPALERAVGRVHRELRQPALVEEFVDGREMYVSLLGAAPARALPFHEIDFSEMPPGLPRIVSYAGKWDLGSPEYAGSKPMRCVLDDATRERVERSARAAFEALDLAGYGRVDVRLATDGTPYVIDINPNCDLGDGAGFSRAASFGGLDYPALIEEVCLAALPASDDGARAATATAPTMTQTKVERDAHGHRAAE